jgi:hypothetical protein
MMKITCVSSKERKAMKLEVELMKKLDHPNIVRYHDSFLTARKANLCIMMEYCDGGDLEGHIKRSRGRITESKSLALFVQVALGLHYLHQHRVLHRDLKPQNCFLLGNGRVVLGDFGISKVLEGTMDLARTKIGTPFYMSPQVFRDKPYGAENDIWALGCVLFELMTGKLAFEAQSMMQLIKKVETGAFNQNALGMVKNRECKDLVRAMLTVDQRKRPSAKSVLLSPLIRQALIRYMGDVHRRAGRGGAAAGKPVGAGTMKIDAALQQVAGTGTGGSPDGLVQQLEALGLQGVVEAALETEKDLHIASKVGGFQTLDKNKRAKIAREQLLLLQREDQTRKMLEAELERQQEEMVEAQAEEEEEQQEQQERQERQERREQQAAKEEEQPIVAKDSPAQKQEERPVVAEAVKQAPVKSQAQVKLDERQQQRQDLERRQHQLQLAQQKGEREKQQQQLNKQKQKQKQEHEQQKQRVQQKAREAREARGGKGQQPKQVQQVQQVQPSRRQSNPEPMQFKPGANGAPRKELPAALLALMDDFKPGEQPKLMPKQQEQKRPRSRPSVGDLRARSPAISPMVEGANKKAEDMHKAFANANAKQGGEGKSRRKHSQPVRFSDKLEQRREQQWRKNQSALRRKLGFQIDEEKRLVMQPLSEIGGGKGSSIDEDEDEVATMGQQAAMAEMKLRQRRLQSQVTDASQRCEDLRARLMESKVVGDRQALYGEKLDSLLQEKEDQ